MFLGGQTDKQTANSNFINLDFILFGGNSHLFYFNTSLVFRNNCEMTHFFFSLIREPGDQEVGMPLIFYFDTHIITKVTLNVRHTFFDKVRLSFGQKHDLKELCSSQKIEYLH